jgi:hypothetical protein
MGLRGASTIIVVLMGGAVSMDVKHERNLWFGEPNFKCRLHQTHLKRDQGWPRITLVGRFAPWAGFVTQRQTFVHCRHTGGNRPDLLLQLQTNAREPSACPRSRLCFGNKTLGP